MRRAGCVGLLAFAACVGCGGSGGSGNDASDASGIEAPSVDAADADSTGEASTDAADAAAIEAASADAPLDTPRPPAPAWSAPAPIDKIPAGNAKPPLALQMDAAGNAFTVWRHSNAAGSVFSIEANRFDKTTSFWSPPVTLENTEAATASDPDLAVDPAGGAVVVWSQGPMDLASIWSNWYDAGTNLWHGPTLVEIDETGEAYKPQVAALPGGGAVAVWYQWDGLRESVWANQLAGGRWTGRALLETTDSAHAIDPDVAADPNGNAVAVWTEMEPDERSTCTIWSSRRAATASAWGAPFMLAGPHPRDPMDTPQPRVALDARGDGLAIWALRVNAPARIWASRYHRGADTWEPAVPIDADDGGDSGGAQLALDASGDAFVTWRQRSGGGSTGVWANRFSARTGTWGTPQRLDDDDGGDAVFPAVAAAGDGQAVAVWQQSDSSSRVFASRLGVGSARWTAAARLDAGDTAAIGPKPAIDATGNAFAIWTQRQNDWDDLLFASGTF